MRDDIINLMILIVICIIPMTTRGRRWILKYLKVMIRIENFLKKIVMKKSKMKKLTEICICGKYKAASTRGLMDSRCRNCGGEYCWVSIGNKGLNILDRLLKILGKNRIS